MYWSRERLKELARVALHGSYWKSVFVTLVFMLVTGLAGGGGMFEASFTGSSGKPKPWIASDMWVPLAIALFIMSVAVTVIGIAIVILIFNPAEVGCRGYYDDALYAPTDPRVILKGYGDDYKNVVRIQFRRMLNIILWGLLLIVPGVIKAYEYRMMPYLLADNPGMDMKECFARSKAMMDGEKKQAFILDLTFLGWFALSVLTFGLLYIFYVGPYYNFTCAALYGALKRKMEGQPIPPAEFTESGDASEPENPDEAPVSEYREMPADVPEEMPGDFQQADLKAEEPAETAEAVQAEIAAGVPSEPAPWDVYASSNPAPWDTSPADIPETSGISSSAEADGEAAFEEEPVNPFES